MLVPPEQGSDPAYLGNPYLIAKHLAGNAPCFISHAYAMEIYRMVTQPQFVVFASSPKRLRTRMLGGTEFHFVYIPEKYCFGTARHRPSKQDFIEISDPERTVIDGLRQPEYCGGITEVAKGLWMRHGNMQAKKLSTTRYGSASEL